MERALSQNSYIDVLVTTGTVPVTGEQDVTFIGVGCTTFKVGGSTDGGSTYNDLAGTSITGDGTAAQRQVLSLFRPMFDHLKVTVGNGGSVVVIRRIPRFVPEVRVLTGGSFAAYTKHIAAPTVGTA